MKTKNNVPVWLGYLNFILLQWFFVRLAKVITCDNQNHYIFIGKLPLTGWIWPWQSK